MYVQYFLLELNDKGDWSALGYIEQFDSFLAVNDNVERIHVKDFPPSEFIEKYEKLYKPVVICGIQDNWKAKHKWTCEVSCSINGGPNSSELTGCAAVIVFIFMLLCCPCFVGLGSYT